MRVIVASTNPTKIDAARFGFGAVFPEHEIECEGHPVPSGVSDQPMSDDETIRGARNRAANAKAAHPDADFWIGLEGGVHETEHGLAERAWMAVIHKDGREGLGSSGTFFLPPAIVEIIRAGVELGDACDRVFVGTDCRRDNGAIGILTSDAIKRAELYRHGVIFALIPFKNTSLYA